jgi:hypothetical protein
MLLQAIAKPLLLEVERQMPPAQSEKYIGSVIKVAGFEGKVLEALFLLGNPPAGIVAQLKQMAQNRPIPSALVMAVMKASKRAIELGLVTLGDIVEAAAVQAKDVPFPFQFFHDVSEKEMGQVSAEDWGRFFNAYAKADSPDAYRFVVEAVKKSKLFWDSAVAFMALRESSARLTEWCGTARSLVAMMNGECVLRMYNVIRDLTMDELRFGHITTPAGLKLIQKSAVHPVKKAQGFCRRGSGYEEGLGEPSEHDAPPMLVLRGWRELALLLRLAPPTGDTLELMNAALEVHERPFAQAFAEILQRYGSLSVAIDWLEELFKGRQSRQVLGLDILWILVSRNPLLFPYLATVLQRFTGEGKAHDLLGAKSRRILDEVFTFGLPPDVLALFQRPEVRVACSPGTRPTRLGRLPVSVSLPPRKGDSELPGLSTSFPTTAGSFSRPKPTVVRAFTCQRRHRMSLVGPCPVHLLPAPLNDCVSC